MITQASPLQGVATGNTASLSIREIPGLQLTELRVAPGAAAQQAVMAALGMELPGKPGHSLSNGEAGDTAIHILCLAPDSWLLVGSMDVESKLAPLRDQYHFSVVNTSGQRTSIELEGPNARVLLAHLWEQDLRDKSFPVGRVSQGLIAKAPVIVWHKAASCYHLMVRSSFAVHVWKMLVDAGAEWV